MLHSRDHDRRRRIASSSDDDDEDDVYEDPGSDPNADIADAALATMAQHVFRRRPAPARTPLRESESSSGEESFIDDELEATQGAEVAMEASSMEPMETSLADAVTASGQNSKGLVQDSAEALPAIATQVAPDGDVEASPETDVDIPSEKSTNVSPEAVLEVGSHEPRDICPVHVADLQSDNSTKAVKDASEHAIAQPKHVLESSSTTENVVFDQESALQEVEKDVLQPSPEKDAVEGETGELTPRRREFEEPPIPRNTRFFLHDNRFDDDASSERPTRVLKSRADCDEWKHDMFERFVANNSSPRVNNSSPRYYNNRRSPNDRPRHRWVPKGSHDLSPQPKSVTTSVPEVAGPGSQHWKSEAPDAHAKNARPKRWVPRQKPAPSAEPEPERPSAVLDSSWGSPEPVQAPVVEETIESPPTETKSSSITTMNPEAQEFQLPTTESYVISEDATISNMVYASEMDPETAASMGYWMSYDGVMMAPTDPNIPSVYEYGYSPDVMGTAPGMVYYIPSPYETPIDEGRTGDSITTNTIE